MPENEWPWQVVDDRHGHLAAVFGRGQSGMKDDVQGYD